MLELIDTRPDVNVQESEYKRLLGYPSDYRPEGRSFELAAEARRWYANHGKPWILARHTGALDLTDQGIKINGIEFSSNQLRDQFGAAQADSATLVAVSAGKECEERALELWQEGKPDEYFFMEMFGSAVVEHLVSIASGQICGWADQNRMIALPHYSPGYSGWDVSDQINLWKLIQQGRGDGLPGELHVMETGMLRPKKSLLAVIGITRHVDKVRHFRHLVPCENCSLSGCSYRRAPYRHFPSQIEDVRRLQSTAHTGSLEPGRGASGLNHAAKYSVNSMALQKWAQERLQLTTLHDGSVRAHFRYEGTTCLSAGRPLEFDYHLKLGPPTEAYTIADAICCPAPGDTGHACQCEYLNNAEALNRSIASEKPLLGRPLNDVLAWERPYSPSGCYCDADRRAHKWGLVLEVIHFALVQRERNLGDRWQPATWKEP